jgi:hypothetical protein
MGTITWTREAKCKDCDNIRYFYQGKRKFHKCIAKDRRVCLNDKSCYGAGEFDKYKMRREYYPKKLEE